MVWLNCRYWIIDSRGIVCDFGKGFTNPDDSCCMFVALNSMDDDYNSYLNKSKNGNLEKQLLVKVVLWKLEK